MGRVNAAIRYRRILLARCWQKEELQCGRDAGGAGITATVKRPNTAPDAPRLIVVAERRKRLARFEHTCRAAWW